MRHFRRSRRHRSHGYGSYAHHGWYGRDAKKGKKKPKNRPGMSWQQFIKANKHLSQFRTRKGLLNFKKLSVAWRKVNRGKPAHSKKVSAKQKAGRENFLARLRSMKSAISNIGKSPKKHRATTHHKKRTMTAAAKLRVAERMLWQAGAALNHARSRVAKKAAAAAAKKAAAARKKAEADAKKPHSPKQAKAAAEAAEKAQKAAVAAAYSASQKAGQYDLTGRKQHEQSLFPWASNLIGRDPRRGKKKGKKKGAKKKSSAKRRSSARKSRKMSAATKKKLKAAQKRYWTLVRGFMRKGSTLKGARKKASAAYKKKYGRDFEADFGRDFASDFDL